jgi:hypothetical protein
VSIEVNDRTVGFWFVTIPNGDWMAGLQALDGGRFKLQYRFRYYKDDKAFDSDDKKNWYSGEGDDYGSAVRTLRMVAEALKQQAKGEMWEVLRGDGTVNDFMDKFMKLPFVHAKKAFEAKDLPDAPPSPTDGQPYIDPKSKQALHWDAEMKMWVADETLDRGDEHG